MAKRTMRNEYRPYIKEFLYCLGIDAIIILILIVCAVAFGAPLLKVMGLYILPAFLVAETAVNYRLAILICIERRSRSPIQRRAAVISIDAEWSASGKYESIIEKLYPKEMEVGRYKIICEMPDNKRFRVRSVMVRKRAFELEMMHMKGRLNDVSVTFGPLSKIVFKITLHDKKGRAQEDILFFDNRL